MADLDSVLAYTANLMSDIDKKLMIVLKDGRTLIGFLRSVDQFANLVLQDTIERIHVGKQYGDIPRGLFVIRGDNVAILGEMDDKKDLTQLQKVSIEDILDAQREQLQRRDEETKLRNQAMLERGLQPHGDVGSEDTL
ncbi:U6 snRNA-associated Sm-like protein LSm1 [Trichoplax sp. H2]|uniref:U6 snRNA-associated Sm-like protein LSm1 n=1 Tax=Trichoplax adhaerens TaxID=10228 RepID=B3S3F7_TRIAD|nr:hypothetical protein TRIADDRAFT_58702 [Trichoplax adhaerens]EDV22959.1 hypothetical protein TRIADDRAFT_58702 [Trichoplax adhaerens]RDD38320.1 U6 snRNA-associated Sm-like protein LSm1 [Trichoplax sp. H2]|eukprot:XP_002114825.1 hypothetical protein TRIADDRAFT_58702 [Trichoplax adhaerens]